MSQKTMFADDHTSSGASDYEQQKQEKTIKVYSGEYVIIQPSVNQYSFLIENFTLDNVYLRIRSNRMDLVTPSPIYSCLHPKQIKQINLNIITLDKFQIQIKIQYYVVDNKTDLNQKMFMSNKAGKRTIKINVQKLESQKQRLSIQQKECLVYYDNRSAEMRKIYAKNRQRKKIQQIKVDKQKIDNNELLPDKYPFGFINQSSLTAYDGIIPKEEKKTKKSTQKINMWVVLLWVCLGLPAGYFTHWLREVIGI